MKVQVLIDLDNVLYGRAADPMGDLLRWLERASKEICEATRGHDSCTVSIGLNTDTAIVSRLTFDSVRGLGGRVAEYLGCKGTLQVEIGLTLTMPQAVDVLLERLARESPTADGAGTYQTVVLMSGDKGLAASLAESPYGGWVGEPWSMGRIWRRVPDDVRSPRKPPGPVVGPGWAPAVPNLTGHTILAEGSDGVAAWASQRLLDLDPRLEMYEIASLIDESPWLLSQIGPTGRSLRGLERLSRLPCSDPPRLEPFSKSDGVEVLGEGKLPPNASAPCREASVGPGAVRFSEARTTVSSRIPPGVLNEANGPYPLYPCGVPTTSTLSHLPADQTYSRAGGIVSVVWFRRGQDLILQVKRVATYPPKAWWVKVQRALSEVRVRDQGYLLPHKVESAAWPLRPRAGTGYALGLGVWTPGGARVVAGARIDRGCIGQAEILDGNTLHKAALLATVCSFAPGEMITAVPIQATSRSGSLGGYPVEFWSFPLLVARQ